LENHPPKEKATMDKLELNPQPEPPGKPKIDLADLTEAVTSSVRRVLEEREISEKTPGVFRNPRIVIGVIFEPADLNPQPLPP
jgi:hypothetical protein